MNWLRTWLMNRRPSEAGRTLARMGSAQRKAFIRATARQMCIDMGRPVPKALRK